MMQRSRGHILFVLALILAIGPAASTAAQGKIAFRESSEVPGRSIFLGDVAELSGMTDEQTRDLAIRSLGPSPRPGQTLRWRAGLIEDRLEKAGINPGDFELVIPDKVAITRKTLVVTGQEMAEFAARYLESKFTWAGEPVQVQIEKTPRDITLGYGKVALKGELDLRPGGYGIRRFTVHVFLDGESEKKLNLQPYLGIIGMGIVAGRPISKGEVLEEEDMELMEMNLNELPSDAVRTVEMAVGQQARNNMQPGDPIRTRDLEINPDVERGDMVTLLIKGKGFSVTARGKAKEDGSVGDTIRVQVENSKKTVEGVILDSETVEVLRQ